jgi:hypothetical protein
VPQPPAWKVSSSDPLRVVPELQNHVYLLLESAPVILHSPATQPWWVIWLLKFAKGIKVCDHGPWTLPYRRAEWERKNDHFPICV